MDVFLQHASVLNGFLDLGVALGIPVETLLREADIDPDILGSDKASVTNWEFHKVFRQIYDRANDTLFPLKIAPLVMSSTHDVVRDLMRGSQNLGESFADFIQFQNLLFPEFEMRFELGESVSTFYIPFRPLENPHFDTAYCLTVYAILFSHCNYLTGGNWRLLSFHSEFQEWQPLQSYQSFYRCPLLFNQAETKMTFTTESLSFSLAGNHLAGYRERIKKQAIEQQTNIEKATEIYRKSMAYIRNNMNQDDVSATDLAKHLDINLRTLQRYLKLSNTNPGKIRDQVRKQLAIEEVTQSGKPFCAISDQLGFSNTGSFYRAFKRWTQQTPGELRAHQCQTPSHHSRHQKKPC